MQVVGNINGFSIYTGPPQVYVCTGGLHLIGCTAGGYATDEKTDTDTHTAALSLYVFGAWLET